MSAQAIPTARPRRSALEAPWLRLTVRVLLALMALWLVNFASNQYVLFHKNYVSTLGRMDLGSWLLWVGSLAAAGLVFGLAAWFPFTSVRYLGSRLLLGALAFLPLAYFWLVAFYLARRHPVGGWLSTDWFWDVASQTALAVLGGVAVASGFTAKRSEPSPRRGAASRVAECRF
jgi:hypothetical protein